METVPSAAPRTAGARAATWTSPLFLLFSPLLLSVPLGACGSGEPEASGTAVRDSAGVTIVESREPAWSEGEGWRVAPEPTLEIGVVDGEAAYQFRRIREVFRTPDGRVLVADGGSREIRAFGPSGRHLATLGGPGEGPGEFRRLNGMVVRRDTILVFDPDLGRLTAFDTSGALLGTTRLEPTGDPIHPLRNYRVGGVVEGDVVMSVWAYPADMRPTPTAYWDTLPTLRYARDGALIDTVGEFSGMDTYSTPDRAGSITFARFSSFEVHDDRLYMTDGGEYEVRVYAPGAGPVRILRVLREPRPATEELLDAYFGRMLEGAETPEARRRIRENRMSWEHREALPWISDLVVDEAGHVWVEEYRHRLDPSPRQWGVFGPDGAWLGRVEMPPGFEPAQIGREFVLGVARDALGVEYVRQYALERDPRGG